MRAALKQLSAWAAVYLIALQAVVGGLAFPLAGSAASFDPAAVICHSSPQDAGSGTTTPQPGTPLQNCDHCVLCNAAPAADLPGQISQVARPGSRGERLPYPALTAPQLARAMHQHWARGPPRIV